jgi:hypothetical protein
LGTLCVSLRAGKDGLSPFGTCIEVQDHDLRQRYREGQEDQLGAVGLVLSVIVLGNMRATLNHLRSTGVEVKAEDVARASPIQWSAPAFYARSCGPVIVH